MRLAAQLPNHKGDFMGKANSSKAASATSTTSSLPVGEGNQNWERVTSTTGSEGNGPIQIVRPSKLDAAGITGVVAEGLYEKSEPNKFDATKNDYFIRGTDNTLYIVNASQSLTEQFNELKGLEGSATVRIVYNGKKETKRGKGYHDFEVLIAR